MNLASTKPFRFGQNVISKSTGVKGFINSFKFHAYGCVTVSIQTETDPQVTETFSMALLDVVDDGFSDELFHLARPEETPLYEVGKKLTTLTGLTGYVEVVSVTADCVEYLITEPSPDGKTIGKTYIIPESLIAKVEDYD